MMLLSTLLRQPLASAPSNDGAHHSLAPTEIATRHFVSVSLCTQFSLIYKYFAAFFIRLSLGFDFDFICLL